MLSGYSGGAPHMSHAEASCYCLVAETKTFHVPRVSFCSWTSVFTPSSRQRYSCCHSMPGNFHAEQSRTEMRGDSTAGNKDGSSSINKPPRESRRQLLHDWTGGSPFLYGMKIIRHRALSQKEGADDENNTDRDVLDGGNGSSALTLVYQKTWVPSFSSPWSSSSGINKPQGDDPNQLKSLQMLQTFLAPEPGLSDRTLVLAFILCVPRYHQN